MDTVKSWISSLFSGPALATIVVALVGQAVFSIVYQVSNNEQQGAAIYALSIWQQSFEKQINNLQTPLSQRVLKIDDRLEDLIRRYDENNKRLEAIDITGTRALVLVNANQQRVMTQVDRLAERLIILDKRIGDLDVGGSVNKLQNQVDIIGTTLKRLEEQQARIIQALDDVRSPQQKK